MSDNNDEHEFMDVQVAAVLRRTDEQAEQALRARLDIEGRLAEVIARGTAQRASGKKIFGVDTGSVLAAWSVDLTATGVRTLSGGRRLVRAVTDPDFFAAALGRPRSGLEPWPDLAIEFDPDSAEVMATLSLPSRPPREVHVVAVA